jgi:hypothetical protein
MIFVAVAAFAALFAMFVIVPTLVQKRHERAEAEEFGSTADA